MKIGLYITRAKVRQIISDEQSRPFYMGVSPRAVTSINTDKSPQRGHEITRPIVKNHINACANEIRFLIPFSPFLEIFLYNLLVCFMNFWNFRLNTKRPGAQ